MKNLLQFALVLISFFPNFSNAENAPTGCQEGDCSNGYGKYVYANGNRYVGEFTGGKPHGQGILYCSNGNKYLGQWENSWRQGRGKFIFQEGHVYTGGFQRNNFHGKGIMKYSNGDRYEGNWRTNKPNGQGKYFFQKGGQYEGNFENGLFHGKGIMYYANGSVYEGEWWKNKKKDEKIDTDESPVNPVETSPELGYKQEERKEKEAVDNSRSYDVNYPYRSTSVRIWAIVVGVATYNHMPSLRYTDDDAYNFYAFLKSPEGGALPDNQVQVLVDDNATKEKILTSMRTTLLSADEDDVILFYFSGHGVRGAFIPTDFDGFKNRLYHHEVREILDMSRAKHKLVLGDACHAGSLYGDISTEDFVASRSTMESMLTKYYGAFENSNGGMALLLSSKGEEVSLEDSGLRSGVFSHFLIRGLKGEADRDRNKIVTVEELYDYTNYHVSGYTVGAQTPVLSGVYDRKMPVSVVR